MKMLTARWVRRTAIGIVALLIAGFAVGSLDRSPQGSQSLGGRTKDASNAATELLQRGSSAGGGAVTGAFQSGVSSEALDANAGPAALDGAPASALPPLPDRIVKTGDLTLEVKAARFEDAWTRASSIAARFGGYVAGSSRGTATSPESRDRSKNGEIMIRVPSARFDAAMTELRKIGKVASDNVASQDVTQEFTDLEGRLRNLKAQEAVLLRLMASAKSVQDTLVVQQHLSNVQGEIEQIQGRLKLLRSLTEMSTISLHIAEPGASSILGPDEGPSFSQAWDTAVEGLVRMGTVAMIAAVWMIPFGVLALLVRTLVRRRPPVAEQS